MGKSTSAGDGVADLTVQGEAYSDVPQAAQNQPIGAPIVALRIGRGLLGIAAGGYHVPG